MPGYSEWKQEAGRKCQCEKSLEEATPESCDREWREQAGSVEGGWCGQAEEQGGWRLVKLGCLQL